MHMVSENLQRLIDKRRKKDALERRKSAYLLRLRTELGEIDWLARFGRDDGALCGGIFADEAAFKVFEETGAREPNQLVGAENLINVFISIRATSNRSKGYLCIDDLGQPFFASIDGILSSFDDRIASALDAHGIGQSYLRKIRFDLGIIARGIFYRETPGLPTEVAKMLEIYSSGHIPCGWAGDYDNWAFGGAFFYR